MLRVSFQKKSKAMFTSAFRNVPESQPQQLGELAAMPTGSSAGVLGRKHKNLAKIKRFPDSLASCLTELG